MLTKIEIMNIKSIKYISIDLSKAKYQYLDEMIFNERNVNPISIYGKNGSGKSSILLSICFAVSLLIDDKEKLGAFTPNAFNLANYSLNNKPLLTPSFVKLYFVLDDKEYEYLIETSLECITKEYLKIKNKKIFERTQNIIYTNEKDIPIEKTFYPALRKLANDITDESNSIVKAFNFLSNISFLDPANKIYMCNCFNHKSTNDMIVEKSSDVKDIMKKYSEFPLYEVKSQIDQISGQKRYYYHYDFNPDINLPLEYLSSGMHKNSLLLTLLLSLPKNGVLIIDELEHALHPSAILDFLKIVKEKNIQLIFSSHNTFILQQLRPAQVFFAYWKDGESTYKKLSDIYPNIRQVNNIEKMYLSNLFDDVIKNEI